jgi:hypothetical protein
MPSLLASTAVRCAEIAVEKMATQAQKTNCVLWFHETKSVTVVQIRFRRESVLNPPSRLSIYAWYKQFTQSDCFCNIMSSGRPSVSEATVDRLLQGLVCSPQKSTGRASRKLSIPQPTVWKIFRKRFLLECFLSFSPKSFVLPSYIKKTYRLKYTKL